MRRTLIALALSIAVAGCSSTASVKIQAGLANFRANVAAVNETIRTVSLDLAANCEDIQFFTQALVDIAKDQRKIAPHVESANAAIVTWCQAPPSNVASAVTSTARIAKASQAAYNDAVKRFGG